MTLFGKLTDEEGGRLAFPNHHLLVTGWQVLLWIRDGRGKETKLKKKKPLNFLQVSPRMTSLRQGNVLVFPPHSPTGGLTQVFSLRRAIMYTNNKSSNIRVKVTEADPV